MLKANRSVDWALAATAGAVMLALAPQTAMAQAGTSASATAQAGATVVVPLVVTAEEEIDFGAIASGSISGTVIVTVDDKRSATGGASLLGGADFHRAEFKVVGPPNASYKITLPSTLTAEHDSSSPGPNLNVVNLVSFSTEANAVTDTGVIGPGGSDMVYVGGTIEIPAGAKNGKYEADVVLTVEFQ